MANSPAAINSIAEMKKFVEEYPEFRKLGGNVSKHVALVGELSRLVGKDKLLEVGEVEQGLATSTGSDLKVGFFSCWFACDSFHEQSVQECIVDPAVTPQNKLRLVILYALRYQKAQTSNIATLINLLLANGVSKEDARVCFIKRI
jgi:hypothetical protein